MKIKQPLDSITPYLGTKFSGWSSTWLDLGETLWQYLKYCFKHYDIRLKGLILREVLRPQYFHNIFLVKLKLKYSP